MVTKLSIYAVKVDSKIRYIRSTLKINKVINESEDEIILLGEFDDKSSNAQEVIQSYYDSGMFPDLIKEDCRVEQQKVYSRRYYVKNRGKIIFVKQTSALCEVCNSYVTMGNRSKHYRTLKHTANFQIMKSVLMLLSVLVRSQVCREFRGY